MDMSDFLGSVVIGAVAALTGIHVLGLFGDKTEGNEEIKDMGLEQLMAKKEELEDLIAENLAVLKPEGRTAKSG